MEKKPNLTITQQIQSKLFLDEEKVEQKPQKEEESKFPMIIKMADSDNEIIQFENGEVYLRRFDPISNKTQMINMNKIKEVDFQSSKITLDSSPSQKQIQKYILPKYEPFQFYPVISSEEIPERRGGHSLVTVGQFLILFGGCYLDLNDQEWSIPKTFGEPPSPRGGHSTTLVGQYIYIYGGSSNFGILGDIYRFDLQNRVWEELLFIGPKPPARCNHKAILDNNGRIVFFGGYTINGYTNDVYFLDLVNKRWEKPFINGEAPRPRENFSMSLIRDSYIWIFGGYSIGGENNDIWQLDTEGMKWRIITQSYGAKPIERQGHSSILHGKYLYIVGGCNYKQEICFNDIYQLNIEDITWTKLDFPTENILSESDNQGVSLMGTTLYIFAGCKMMEKCNNDFFAMNISDICPKNCHNNGICRNDRCQCNEGYFGEACEIKLYCEHNCSNRGVCGSDARCKCFPGFTGRVCEVYVPCQFNCTAEANGFCQTDGICKCNKGYFGEACELTKEQVITLECLNNCSNKGVCNTETGICKCEQGYGDIDCSVTVQDMENKRKQSLLNNTQTVNNATNTQTNNNSTQVLQNQPIPQGQSTPQNAIQPQTNEIQQGANNNEQTNQENQQSPQQDQNQQIQENTENNQQATQEGQQVSEQGLDVSDKIALLVAKSLASQNQNKKKESDNDLKNCPNECNLNGICRDSVCYCRQGVTGDDCSAFKLKDLRKGQKAINLLFYVPFWFLIGLLIGALIFSLEQKKQEQKQFGVIRDFNSNLDESDDDNSMKKEKDENNDQEYLEDKIQPEEDSYSEVDDDDEDEGHEGQEDNLEQIAQQNQDIKSEDDSLNSLNKTMQD